MIKAKEKGHFHVQSEPIRPEAQFGSTRPNVYDQLQLLVFIHSLILLLLEQSKKKKKKKVAVKRLFYNQVKVKGKGKSQNLNKFVSLADSPVTSTTANHGPTHPKPPNGLNITPLTSQFSTRKLISTTELIIFTYRAERLERERERAEKSKIFTMHEVMS